MIRNAHLSLRKDLYVHEILILQVELRVSATLLPELQRKKKILLDTVEVQCSRDWYGSPTLLQVRLASRKSIRILSALFLVKRLFTQRFFTTTERKWKDIPSNSPCGGTLPKVVSEMITRMIRHYDQDERQRDAALHWDTTRSVLLKVFGEHGL